MERAINPGITGGRNGMRVTRRLIGSPCGACRAWRTFLNLAHLPSQHRVARTLCRMMMRGGPWRAGRKDRLRGGSCAKRAAAPARVEKERILRARAGQSRITKLCRLPILVIPLGLRKRVLPGSMPRLSLGVGLENAGHGGRKPMALHLHSTPIDRVMPGRFQVHGTGVQELHQVLVKAVHAFVE